MRRLLVICAVTGALLATTAGPALADGEGNNCAGVVSSTLAQASGGGFGDLVSGAAQFQVVDNFGFANCGETSRQNP